ncbi:MAG: S41 family peptidase [Candidatus Amulumruptor caecigallinarius]|nr:S41 family peptidase [Candidatus Amulumruptor caecigallinarius]MCM1397207.1 S41 family peptidase [Candidatus Amulumruptor caecigallinarius]MCM1453104.1 S41 family peptidase [bacterium]
MDKKLKNPAVWLPLVVAVAFIAGMWTMKGLHSGDRGSAAQRKLATMLGIIDQEYVDKVDTDSLLESSFADLIAGLDPHSTYIPASDLEAVNSELEGSFSGIGITFNMLNDSINVLEVISGGPSEKVGLMPGDRIVTIDDSVASGRKWSNERVITNLRGAEGTKVRLGVRRDTARDLLQFEVTRGQVPVTSIDASYMIDAQTGYVKVNKFGRTTFDEFFTNLVKLRADGAKRFIIDLRGNTGGFMEMACLMANEFLPGRQPIVSTLGRDMNANSATWSDGNGTFGTEDVVLLIDEYSASSSEIVAGALQDHDRALVIGRRSFGKGLVQRQIDLDDGSALRLTISRYYTPSGRCIQKTYVHGDNDTYATELMERYTSGEVFSADSIKVDRALIYTTDGGREVYGGGGIMPDIFVPSDTSAVTSYYLKVLNAGLLQKFCLRYADSHRSTLKTAKSTSALLAMLPSDDALLQEFVEYAAANGVPARWYYINISRRLLVTDLKALIARDILGSGAYYEVANRQDPTVQRALTELDAGSAKPPVKVSRH